MPAPPSLPADARRSLLIYNLFFPLVLLAMLPGLLVRMLRRGNYRENFGQRLGRYTAADRERFASGEWIWLHSISVGETLLALRLVREFRRLAPEKSIALSVTTSTGYAVAKPHADAFLEIIYNPLDAPSIVRRTLDMVRPRRLIFIEAVWPNLLAEARRRAVPVTFLPRLSPRSEKRFRRFRHFTGPIFRLVDSLAVPELEDIARWESLGVDRARIRLTGNVKFDPGEAKASREGEFRALLDSVGVAGEAPVLLGGSTFPGEEKILAETFRALREKHPGLFLIIVPRHVERAAEIIAELRPLDFRIQLRSTLSAENGPADILLVDTTGELRDWYALASVVFIGKSLTATGGQNPVEPVLAGKPVVFGPHMENFAPIVTRWLAADAAIQVGTAADLRTQIDALLADPVRRTTLAERARAIVEIHAGATARTAACLLDAR
jgi:3-deoxy-D-manno-octulosonic-acid transferase